MSEHSGSCKVQNLQWMLSPDCTSLQTDHTSDKDDGGFLGDRENGQSLIGHHACIWTSADCSGECAQIRQTSGVLIDLNPACIKNACCMADMNSC